jgi:hypothetical protein
VRIALLVMHETPRALLVRRIAQGDGLAEVWVPRSAVLGSADNIVGALSVSTARGHLKPKGFELKTWFYNKVREQL